VREIFFQTHWKLLLHYSCTYWPLTQTEETLPCAQELSTPSYQGPKNPVHISHSTYIIPTYKKSSDVGKGYQYICPISLTLPIVTSMLEIVTLMLQNLRSTFYTTIKRNSPSFVLSAIQILTIKWPNTFICTQTHSTHNDFSPFRKLFFKPF